ncbi:hypothetical protein ARMSODRAFT_1020240 [Armillaria solidipes]|uniref:Uncharacterized protein n=1 Tax=Armillaria solidipes TaxID=1076256 RepID=A0A2H3BUY2_9AGAR|nr:hypothetical protein ARMSODRAFT_1020240 [Armillaria solidipes]
MASFLMHGSREYRTIRSPLPRDRPDGCSNVQAQASNLLTFFSLPPLALGKIVNDNKENPTALGGGRDEKGRESHTPARLAWMLIDITENDTLVSTQSRRCSHYNSIHARMGVLLLAFDACRARWRRA